MRLNDILRRRPMRADDADAPMRRFTVSFDDEDANFVTTPDDFALLRRGSGQRGTQEQYVVLEMLEERGAAFRIGNGFAVRAFDVTSLDDDEHEILGLPPRFAGQLTADVRGNTTSSRFLVTLGIERAGRSGPLRRRGPVLYDGSEPYILSPAALKIARAVDRHAALAVEERTEVANVRLVAEIQSTQSKARSDHTVDFRLGHLERFTTVTPESVGLIVTPRADGSLALSPDLGADVDADLVQSRLHHLDDSDDAGVIRVGNELVLLEHNPAQAVRELRRKHTIPAEHVADFLASPGSFINSSLVDIDISFGVRVEGVGVIVPQTFADASESGISWFGEADGVQPADVLAGLIRTLPDLERAERAVELARSEGRTTVALGEALVDISDVAATHAGLDEARKRIAQPVTPGAVDGTGAEAAGSRTVRVGMHVAEAAPLTDSLRAAAAPPATPPAVRYDLLRRQPFLHQREGVEWIVEMLGAAVSGDERDPTRVQGALLADDMGLGKTYMTLVALGEFTRSQATSGHEARPTLAVLPVSLLENWESEIAATFPASPFRDVVVLQGTRDLARFRLEGAARETRASANRLDDRGMLAPEDIRLSLKVGETYGLQRLDQPGRLVLTTYRALADYQLSLSQVDWGVVVFDEAQTLKNPDTLAARAAKALKAQFKLLATGTPIENSMLDFWSLMDTAQPGLLGSWSDFRREWVDRLTGSTDLEKARVGAELRELVGRFMLRRVKEDHLADLPSKTVYGPIGGGDQIARPDLGQMMPAVQRDSYDAVLTDYRRVGSGTKGAALAAIQALRTVSLHPGAVGDALISDDDDGVRQSARLLAVFALLDEIRQKGEKAIVFAMSKKVQTRLATWISRRYQVHVRIVNGDTAAVSRGSAETRRSIIAEFEAAGGFNVIIMSPLAVGVGLTVVGANHAIHLERHWNPAKEAQATDRIYRIGQTRPVHVYLPMALHPDMESFDVSLDRLLRGKTTLRNAVVVPDAVTEDEMMNAMGLAT